MKFIYILLIVLSIIGCSSKDIDSLWQKDQQSVTYRTKLIKTQHAILTSGETKIYIIATYMNDNIDKSKSQNINEQFIISLYIEGNSDLIFGKDYYITLSDKQPLSIKKLNINDPLLRDISFKNSWKTYYLLEFSHITDDRLFMLLHNKQGDKVKLYFAKRAKYTLEK